MIRARKAAIMAKKPCDCDSGKMTFEQWAAAGGAIPLSFKGREKAWANQVRKYAAGGAVDNTVPDMSDGGQIIDGPSFQAGGIAKLAKSLTGAKKAKGADKPSAGPAFGAYGYTDDLLRRERGSFASVFGVDYGQTLAPSFEFAPVKRLNTTEKVDEAKVRSLMQAMKESGNTLDNRIPPVVVDSAGNVLDGHHRVEAARRLGYDQVPVIEKFDRQSGPKFGDEYAGGGEVKIADGGKVDKPYIGYRRAGRRPESQQDREASANIPVAVARGLVSGSLGMPGDIESLARLPYELITGKESPTILPTSKDIEKRLPFRGASQTPVGQMFTGASQLAGGAYTGPGSGARAVMAVPKAVVRAGKDFVQAAGQPAVNVIKPKGGNFLTGSVEKAVAPLKSPTTAGETAAQRIPRHRALLEDPSVPPESKATVQRHLDEEIKRDALDQWIDRNLTNYIKKEMATPEDPVRKLAEQGISHLPADAPMSRYMDDVWANREKAGFPAAQGTSRQAQVWESLSDSAVRSKQLGETIRSNNPGGLTMRDLIASEPGGEWAAKAPDTQFVHELRLPGTSSIERISPELGFDHIVDVLKQDLAAGRIRPEQLSKVSMEQAVRRTYDFDQEMAKKMREAQIKATEGMPVHKEYPEGYKWVELTKPEKLPEGWEAGKPSAFGEPTYRKVGSIDNFIDDPRVKTLEDALKYEGETMGHCVGGYCPDVLEGRSRIYSLRDAKGEPHVTVEVQPSKTLTPEKRAAQMESLMHRLRGEGMSEEAAIKQAEKLYPESETLSRIVQIKGKQNKAPKEEYLPFVQDFVRGGKWSGVGDFQNTGLIRKSDLIDKFGPDELDAIGKGEYLTKGEYDNLLLKALKPEDGMKAGGEVKMQAGGAASVFKNLLGIGQKGKGAAKSLTQAEKNALRSQGLGVPGEDFADVMNPADVMRMSEALGNAGAEGKTLNLTQADRSRVFGPNKGGTGFSGLQLTSPAHQQAGTTWGVGKPSHVTRLINANTPDTLWTTFIGSPTQHMSNPVTVERMYEAHKKANPSAELIAKMNKQINSAVNPKTGKPIFPESIDISDPASLAKAQTFDQRKVLAQAMTMGGEKKGEKATQEAFRIVREETDPLLVESPTYAVGNRLWTIDKDAGIYRPDLNAAFPYQVVGTDLGLVYNPAPVELAVPEFFGKFANRLNKSGKPQPMGHKDLTATTPKQLVDYEYLTNLQKAGYAKGGKVGGLSQAKNQRKK